MEKERERGGTRIEIVKEVTMRAGTLMTIQWALDLSSKSRSWPAEPKRLE